MTVSRIVIPTDEKRCAVCVSNLDCATVQHFSVVDITVLETIANIWLAVYQPASQPEIDDSFKDRESDRRKVMYCLRFQLGLCDSTLLFGGRHHDPRNCR